MQTGGMTLEGKVVQGDTRLGARGAGEPVMGPVMLGGPGIGDAGGDVG